MEDTHFFWIIPSSYGGIGLVWTEFGKKRQVQQILLSRPEQMIEESLTSLYPRAIPHEGKDLPHLVGKIEAYLAGQDISFSLADLGEKGLSEEKTLRRNILLQAMAIPRGMVDSYGGLAEKIGHSRAARVVGTAMATNPFPLVVPCHRLVRSDGSVGQFGGGVPMKKGLLNMEGVLFDHKGKVFAANFYR